MQGMGQRSYNLQNSKHFLNLDYTDACDASVSLLAHSMCNLGKRAGGMCGIVDAMWAAMVAAHAGLDARDVDA